MTYCQRPCQAAENLLSFKVIENIKSQVPKLFRLMASWFSLPKRNLIQQFGIVGISRFSGDRRQVLSNHQPVLTLNTTGFALDNQGSQEMWRLMKVNLMAIKSPCFSQHLYQKLYLQRVGLSKICQQKQRIVGITTDPDEDN